MSMLYTQLWPSDLEGYAQDYASLTISAIQLDSRLVKEGDIYFALKGEQVDGVSFISKAFEQGAALVVMGKELSSLSLYQEHISSHLTSEQKERVVQVEDPRYVLSQLVRYYYPDMPSHIVAVTGTNGKSSIVHICQQLWSLCGKSAGSLGTLGFYSNLYHLPSQSLTTPDPIKLHMLLSEAKQKGIDHVAIEVSSHGIEQSRVSGLNISVAAFTNLTPDHMDYHANMEEYFQAKARLFNQLLLKSSFKGIKPVAVINCDDPYGQRLIDMLKDLPVKVYTYGWQISDLRILSQQLTSQGQKISCSLLGREYVVDLPLFGDFQAYNLLAALAMCMSTGMDLHALCAVVHQLKPIPGRLEQIPNSFGAQIFVDYAHMGDALEQTLKTVRKFTKGHLHVVFGCGGDRDPERRVGMGQVAQKLADYVYVTDDNPRQEKPEDIRKEILVHCPKGQEIPDRRKAIQLAISQLSEGDSLVIAGKGHEQGQIIGTQVYPFDDRLVASECV